jgi:hypothetical protein
MPTRRLGRKREWQPPRELAGILTFGVAAPLSASQLGTECRQQGGRETSRAGRRHPCTARGGPIRPGVLNRQRAARPIDIGAHECGGFRGVGDTRSVKA